MGKGRPGAAKPWKQVLGKEMEVGVSGAEGKGAGGRPQVWFCDLRRGMLIWVPATVGAVDVGHVLCPHLSPGGERALGVWQQSR